MIQKIRQLFFWQNYHFKGKIFSTSGIFSLSTACIKKNYKVIFHDYEPWRKPNLAAAAVGLSDN